MQPTDQNPAPAPSEPTKSNSRTLLTAVAGVVAFIVSGALVTAIINNNKDDSPEVPVASFLESTEAREYTSAIHNFKAIFNGFPEIENTTIDVEGFTVPYSSYLAGDEQKVSGVIVADYSQFDDFDVQAGLEGSVNGAVQNTPGAVLQDIQFIDYQGREAAAGHYTVPLGSETFEGRILAIYENKSLYGLLSIGLSEQEFNAFSDSFEFTN